MRVLVSVVSVALLLAACATQPQTEEAPPPDWRVVEQCDQALPIVTGADLARAATATGIKPPKSIKRVSPITPAFHGTQFVQVESVIDETGHVTSICRVSGEPQFVDAVVSAMRQWTFEPATRDGKPVKVLFSLTTRFHD